MIKLTIALDGRKISARNLRRVRDILKGLYPGDFSVTATTLRATKHNKTYHFAPDITGEAAFFERYSEDIKSATIEWSVLEPKSSTLFGVGRVRFSFHVSAGIFSSVDIDLPKPEDISKMAAHFEEWFEDTPVFQEISRESKDFSPRIFLGHGRSPLWKDLRDHLVNIHQYKVEAYESGSRAGHSIRDIIDEMANNSDIAFLVHTAEDELKEGGFVSRPNVIHETGIFQGKLGFARAIVLLEEGCQEFSNLAGVQQIRFPKGKIRETFGDVLGVIKREFNRE